MSTDIKPDEALEVFLTTLTARNLLAEGWRARDKEVEELVKALRAIANCPGNISDENLQTETGPKDAGYRGEMVVIMRGIANRILNKYK